MNPRAICFRCGEPKDLPLGRCPGCGVVPTGADRDLAMMCSTHLLDDAALAAVQARLRRGEPLRPSAALRERARAALRGTPIADEALGGARLALLFVANLLVTPLLGYAAWFALRRRPGPAGRQTLLVSVASSVVLLVAWISWKFVSADQLADLLGQ